MYRKFGKYWGALWLVEFQGRGAPHIHMLVEMGKLTKKEWEKWLEWFIKAWSRALGQTVPSQAVDFNVMKKRDFRYARKYAAKMRQKVAPFRGRWGRWWQSMGSWARVKDEVYVLGKVCKKKIEEDIVKMAIGSRKLLSVIDSWLKGRTHTINLYWSQIEQSDNSLARFWLKRREWAQRLNC